MASAGPIPLLLGEVSVDVTITPPGQEQKLRLGGIAHAARGFWASGTPFAAAAVLPRYLEDSAKDYLTKYGCQEFFALGYVSGAPNVTLIFDPTEVDDQEYDTLLREVKLVELNTVVGSAAFAKFADVLVFPGSFDLKEVSKRLPAETRLHMDVAYDIESVDALGGLKRPIATIFLSTSSKLFLKVGASGMGELSNNFAPLNLEAIILKENRGGSRLHIYGTKETHDVPAQLSSTVNSVGVGDVFAATYLTHLKSGPLEAAWRATYASSAYAQTTDPDVFEKMVKRDAQLTLEEMTGLGGTALPWEDRQEWQIYLAAPDFEKADRRAIERAVSSLQYHNFKVRRPVQENGELPAGSDSIALDMTYWKDVELLKQCKLSFSVPTGKDPGTLVEIGLAIADRIPIVVYDPDRECANTMVIAGSDCYSDNLDTCLNAVFTLLSRLGALTMADVLLLSSGGLDSTTVAYWLREKGKSFLPLFFDYGQHCVETEWKTLHEVLPRDGLSPHRINMAGVFRDSRSRLIAEPDLWTERVEANDLYIPYRTLLFFSAGAAFAQTHGMTDVYSGFINSNHAKELDCSATFLNSLDALSENVGPVRFHIPFRDKTKKEVAEIAKQLSVPIGKTYSCQVFSDVPCGACPNCVERLNALQEAGLAT